ncbi:hypothetical protein OY671_010123, partial [Metschnikowia pulcherrima]
PRPQRQAGPVVQAFAGRSRRHRRLCVRQSQSAGQRLLHHRRRRPVERHGRGHQRHHRREGQPLPELLQRSRQLRSPDRHLSGQAGQEVRRRGADRHHQLHRSQEVLCRGWRCPSRHRHPVPHHRALQAIQPGIAPFGRQRPLPLAGGRLLPQHEDRRLAHHHRRAGAGHRLRHQRRGQRSARG